MLRVIFVLLVTHVILGEHNTYELCATNYASVISVGKNRGKGTFWIDDEP